jgi:hypothetical protein
MTETDWTAFTQIAGLVGGILAIVSRVLSVANFLLLLYSFSYDQYRLIVDALAEAKYGARATRSVDFTVTVRNSGRRPVGIEEVRVSGKQKWFPDTPKNCF